MALVVIDELCHFWAQFWPYFNFVDFRAYFGHFPIVKLGISVKYDGAILQEINGRI